MERFPLSQGKIPAIEGPGVKLTETIAIAHVSTLAFSSRDAFSKTPLAFDLGLITTSSIWPDQMAGPAS
jgi:hypothetical protein